MKKLLLTLFLIITFAGNALAKEEDYRQIYMSMPVPTFSYVHGIDPGQYYDNKDATFSVYPLFRLCTNLYFKNIRIEPGYYALTPREYKGEYYMLFKDNGLVKYIVPIYKKELVPQGFYESHIPQPKLCKWDRVKRWFYTFIGNHFKSAKRRPQVQSYLEINDLEDNFISMIIYFGYYRYYTVLRTVQM